jgi:hypothetical protein
MAAVSASFGTIPFAFLVFQDFLTGFSALLSLGWSGFPLAMPPEQTRSMTLAILSLAPPLVVILLVGLSELDMSAMGGSLFLGYGS